MFQPPLPQIAQEALEACFQESLKRQPEEACGVLSSRQETLYFVDRFHPLKNILAELGEKDSKTSIQSPEKAYVMDPIGYLKLERKLAKENRRVVCFFHSHTESPACFSEADQKAALWKGQPLHPGKFYLVCSLKKETFKTYILAYYSPFQKKFLEKKLPAPAFLKPT